MLSLPSLLQTPTQCSAFLAPATPPEAKVSFTVTTWNPRKLILTADVALSLAFLDCTIVSSSVSRSRICAMRTSSQSRKGNAPKKERTHVGDRRRGDIKTRDDVDDTVSAKGFVQPKDDGLGVGTRGRKVVVLATLDRVEDDVAASDELEGVLDGDSGVEAGAGETTDVLGRVEEPAGDGDVRLGEGASVGKDWSCATVDEMGRQWAKIDEGNTPAKEKLWTPWSWSASGTVDARRSERRRTLPSQA